MRPIRDDEDYRPLDYGDCPFCGVTMVELWEDCRDCTTGDDDTDVVAVPCPACGRTVAVVCERTYHLARFEETTT